ncbi:hypothetical protein KAU33_04080 [Candidatus Dependentiae bacterium]|nr:hypothetical protein [Candidatus Dependentiae bacterium]
MANKNRFILINEERRIPIRIQAKEVECDFCREKFYVETDATPLYCPYCKEVIGSSEGLIDFKYRCSISNVGFTKKEGQEECKCAHLGRIQACATCNKVIEL